MGSLRLEKRSFVRVKFSTMAAIWSRAEVISSSLLSPGVSLPFITTPLFFSFFLKNFSSWVKRHRKPSQIKLQLCSSPSKENPSILPFFSLYEHLLS